MELGGALKFLGFLLALQTASDVAERRVRRNRFGVDGFLGFVGSDRGGLIPSGFDLRAIFWREDVVTLQIFGGVNVFGFLLLIVLSLSVFFVLAGAFLASGLGNVLVLSVGLHSANDGNGEDDDAWDKETQTSGKRASGC